MTVLERFWSKVERQADGCWRWTDALSPDGYGKLRVAGRGVMAHRCAYEALVGPIPEGLTIDHLCRNRACVNPDHMEPVSNRENVMRGVSFAAVNASKTHCPKGHPYSGPNLYIQPSTGGRRCRACQRQRLSSPRASQSHCKNGHEFTPANTRIERNGARRCRSCQRIGQQRRRAVG